MIGLLAERLVAAVSMDAGKFKPVSYEGDVRVSVILTAFCSMLVCILAGEQDILFLAAERLRIEGLLVPALE